MDNNNDKKPLNGVSRPVLRKPQGASGARLPQRPGIPVGLRKPVAPKSAVARQNPLSNNSNESKDHTINDNSVSHAEKNENINAGIVSNPVENYKPIEVNKTFVAHDSKPFTEYTNGAPKSETDAIAGSERVVTAVKPQKTRKRKIITILLFCFISIISLMLILLLVLPKASRVSDINVDFTSEYSIKPIEIVDGSGNKQNKKLMPGDDLDCSFKISNKKNSESDASANLSLFVRIKANVICENNQFSNIISFRFKNEEEWLKAADGYYYYQKTDTCNGLLDSDETIDVIKKLHFNINIGNEFAGKSIKVNFIAEALQAEYQAIVEEWPTAPYEWAKKYKVG